VINLIRGLATKYAVPNSQVLYDDDGAGSFIDGFIQNSIPFNNGRPALRKENFKNRKCQMYFKMADRINQDGYYISPEVAKKVIAGKTVEKHLLDERRAIKRDKPDHDGKLAVIPKDQMINIIGHSPDFMDMWMMREFFEYRSQEAPAQTKSSLGLY
jgi:hypothetical protein